MNSGWAFVGAVIVITAAMMIGAALATIDIGSCSHDMVSCRDAVTLFIPPSL